MTTRYVTTLDKAIGILDQGLRLVFGPPPIAQRPDPASPVPETSLTETERALSGRLMRVNHAGEVCAQALYRGQGLTARQRSVQQKLEQAADEENDHLAWTEARLRDLGAHTSYLNPLWYAGSLTIGAVAGLAGDRWSLGFLAETERQVVAHLGGHLQQLPANDKKSRAIVEQMRDDEGGHATTAMECGGATLPSPIPSLMRVVAQVMTRTAYWV